MTDLNLFGASPFDAIRRTRPDGSEYWTARDLMPVMAYARWENFLVPINRAMKTAANTGMDVTSNFRGSQKISSTRPGDDYELTRQAAYLVSMNGDPNKAEVAAAQVYFAVKTREAEVAKPVHEMDELEVAERYVAALRAKKDLERQVAELEPKAEAHDAYMSAEGLFLMRSVAKTLGVQEKVLRQHCYDRHILMAHPARRNEPYAEHVTAGHFEVKSRPVRISDEESIARNTTFVTPAGVEWLRRSLERAGLIEPRSRLSLVRADGA